MSGSCRSRRAFHSGRSASVPVDAVREPRGLPGPRRLMLDPVDQALEVLDRVGDDQLARNDRVSNRLLAPEGMHHQAPMVGRLHRVGFSLVLGVLARQLQKSLVYPVEQLWLPGRDHDANPWLLSGLGLHRRQDAPSGQVAKPLVPGRAELVRDQVDDGVQLGDIFAVQELLVSRRQLQVILESRVAQSVDHALGARQVETNRRVGCNPLLGRGRD